MGLSIAEQETVVSFMRDGDDCTIYTSDSTVMTRLDKLAKSKAAPLWKLVEEHRDKNGDLVGKTYKTNKRLVSFRSAIAKREMTEEQKQRSAESLARYREQWKGK